MSLAVSIAQSGANNVTMRNRIINGAMMIDQRNAGASTTLSTYCLDRWNGNTSGAGVATVQQVSDAPTGFVKSLKLTVSTADSSVTGDDYCQIIQQTEGLNMTDLGWGTANAQSVTVSFWVKSNITGTYCVGFRDANAAYSYVANYTINSASTWEYKTVTVPGATVGTWNTDTSRWGYLTFVTYQGPSSQGTANTWLSGSYRATSSISNTWSATAGNTWQITGVQLEAGTTATAFEQRLYGTELQLCQRYFQIYIPTTQEWIYNETTGNNANKWWQSYATVSMRAAPSVNYSGTWYPVAASNGGGTISAIVLVGATVSHQSHRVTVSASNTAPSNGIFHTDNWNGLNLQLSAEL